jgi:hypothetical protein
VSTLLPTLVRVQAAGNKPGLIDECAGRPAGGDTDLSVAAFALDLAHRDPA